MAQGPIYTVRFAATTIANASGDYDIYELTPVDDGPIQVIGYDITIYSELGDSQEEFLQMAWVTDNATSGNGTSSTPLPVNPRTAAANVFTAETIATTPASTGTAVTPIYFGIPARGGTPGPIWYPDGCGPRVDQADVMLCMRLLVAVTDDVTMSGTIWVEVV